MDLEGNPDCEQITFGEKKYWLLKTNVNEDGMDYVYYMALEIPLGFEGKTIVLDTKGD